MYRIGALKLNPRFQPDLTPPLMYGVDSTQGHWNGVVA